MSNDKDPDAQDRMNRAKLEQMLFELGKAAAETAMLEERVVDAQIAQENAYLSACCFAKENGLAMPGCHL